MRKIILKSVVFIFLLGTALNLFSQNFYFSLNTGYGLNFNTLSYYNETRHDRPNSAYASHIEVKGISFGKGFNVTGALGYMFNKNTGVELGLSYLIGDKTYVSDSYYDIANTMYYSNTTYSARMFKFNPSFLLTAGDKKFRPYAKVGIIIGLGTITAENEDKSLELVYNPYSPGNYSYAVIMSTQTEKMTGSMAFGFSTVLGASLNLSDKFCWFAEFNLQSLSYAPTKGEIVSCTINGQDYMSNLNTSQREIEYSDSFNYDNAVQSFKEPRKDIRVNHPFSSIGVNLGFRAKL